MNDSWVEPFDSIVSDISYIFALLIWIPHTLILCVWKSNPYMLKLHFLDLFRVHQILHCIFSVYPLNKMSTKYTRTPWNRYHWEVHSLPSEMWLGTLRDRNEVYWNRIVPVPCKMLIALLNSPQAPLIGKLGQDWKRIELNCLNALAFYFVFDHPRRT